MAVIKLVTPQETEKNYEEGTTYLDIAREYQKDFYDDIALVRINGKLVELNKTVKNDSTLEFITTSSKVGRSTYRRSVTMLMHRAMYNVDSSAAIQVMQSLGQGFYCEFADKREVTDELIQALKAEMLRLIGEDIRIEKVVMKTDEAMKVFSQYGMKDRGKLLRFRASSNVNVYKIGNYLDYYYGYMMPSTGYLKYFDLMKYEDGLMLLFPGQDTKQVAPFEASSKLFHILKETDEWGKMLGVPTIADLNQAIADGKLRDIILVQEALQERKIAEIAERIVREGRRFVMVAGPSSSGKTSFSHRLSIQLMTLGMKPHPIGLDNYYRRREEAPKDEDGNFDFECLEALDVPLFNENMTSLLNGEEVDMPFFNFKTGSREYRGNKLRLGEGDILVVEGIHGLNEKMSYAIPENEKFKIYISALTQLNLDEHNCLHTTDGRIMRRIVRDARTRATSARETIAMWPSVRRGEEKYIFPYQESADVMFNSSFLFELPVIKPYVQPLLYQIQPGTPEYDEAKRLLKLLDYILPVPSDGINHNSLFREFIGGSCFNV